MVKISHIRIYIGFFIGLSGCSGDLPDYAILGDLRVLAFVASQPEIDSSGGTVTVTPVISDLKKGSIRTLKQSLVGCVDPGIQIGADPSCNNSSDKQVILDSTAVILNNAPSGTYTGAANSITVNVPSTVLANQSPLSQFNGVSYLLVYTLQASDGATLTTIKRILVSTRTPKNSNPSISLIETGDPTTGLLQFFPAVNTSPAPSFRVKMTPTPQSVETYAAKASDGTTLTGTETLVSTWFISDGAMSYDRTVGNDWNTYTPPSAQPSGRKSIVVVVTRDGRGGEDYKILQW